MCAIFTPREKNSPMKNPILLLAAMILLGVTALGAFAQKLDVFADQTFQPALQEIAPMFTEKTGFEVELSLGRSTILAERIRDGISADLFFPASDEVMKQMMEKGLVDVALKRHILDLPSTEPVVDGIVPAPQHISAAVMVNATNRLQAMAFLEFLTSEAARGAFTHQGFALP
jgi:ABC-type molybdate transport system substrate-binding protein